MTDILTAAKAAKPVPSIHPSPSQPVSPGQPLASYGSNVPNFVATGHTQQAVNPTPGYHGSTVFTPANPTTNTTPSGGIYVHGENGTGFYAPPGSSVYNALVGKTA